MPELGLMAWLLRRVLLRGRGAALAAALLAFGMAAIVLLGLSTAATQQVAGRQHDRSDHTNVRLDPGQSSGNANDLRIIDPRATNARRWNGYTIEREFYVPGKSTMVAPGLARMPSAGEFYASPDLIKLIAADPTVGDLFGEGRLVGRIAQDGLAQPHQLRAVIGAKGDSKLLVKVVGFGADPVPAAGNINTARNAVLNSTIAAYVLALVWIPAAFFVLIVSRLASARREKRSAALHLIGYSKRRIQLFCFVEALVVCLPATAIACAIFFVLTHSATYVPGTALGFYPVDAQLSYTKYALVSGGLTFLMCAAAASDRLLARAGRSDNAIANARRGVAAPRIGLVALAAGLVLLSLPTVASINSGFTPLALWSGTLLAAVGIAVAGPALVTRVLAARLEQSRAPALVGRRMASYRVTTALRLASVMSVMVVLLLGSQAFASVLSGGSAQDWRQRIDTQGHVPIVATDLSGRVTLDGVSRIASQGGATELRTLRSGSGAGVNVVFGSCRNLQVLLGSRGTDTCTGAPSWIMKAPAGTPMGPGATLALPSGKEIALPDRKHVVSLPGAPDAFTGALLLPPDLAPDTGQQDGASFFLLVASSTAMPTLARLAAMEPTIQLDLGILDRHNPDIQAYPSQIEWLGVGGVASLVIGFLSLLVVSLGESRERSQRMRALRVLGARRSTLFTTHFWCVSVPLILVGLSAVVVGWLVACAMRNIDDRAHIDADFYGLVTAAIVLGAIGVSLITWRSVIQPAGRSGSYGA